MKKILALIAAFIISVFAGTSFTPAPNKQYSDYVYQINTYYQPDYRARYSGESTVQSGCNTTNFLAAGKQMYGSTGVWFVSGYAPSGEGYGYSLIPTVTPIQTDDNGTEYPLPPLDIKNEPMTDPADSSKKIWSLTGNEVKYDANNEQIDDGEFVIVAPYDCVLLSDSKGSDITEMYVKCTHPITGVSYIIHMENLVCWYCDFQRDVHIPEGYPTGYKIYHTGSEQKGKVFHTGSVLAKGNSATIITILDCKDSSKRLTWKNFRLGEVADVSTSVAYQGQLANQER